MALLSVHGRPIRGPAGFSLLAACLGLLVWGVVLRCGPAFGLHGEPSPGMAQNRMLLDGLAVPGLAAALEPDGLLHLQLRQEFEPAGGGTQRIETEARMGAGG